MYIKSIVFGIIGNTWLVDICWIWIWKVIMIYKYKSILKNIKNDILIVILFFGLLVYIVIVLILVFSFMESWGENNIIIF